MNSKQVVYDFNKVATNYDTVAVLQREIAASMMARLEIINLKPQTILDIGSGTGYGSKLLKKKFKKAKIISVDFAFNMLKVAKKNQSLFSKPTYVCADTNALPFPDNSIDFIFSNLMLHWSSDINKTLQEWLRVLKPEGLLLFSSYGPDTLQELRASWAVVDENPHVHIFLDMHDIGDKLMQAGFSNPVLDVENFQLTFSSVKQLIQELKTLGMHDFSEGKQTDLSSKAQLSKMSEAYEQFKLTDNKYPTTYEVVYGHAWGVDLAAQQKTTASGEVIIPISNLNASWAQKINFQSPIIA